MADDNYAYFLDLEIEESVFFADKMKVHTRSDSSAFGHQTLPDIIPQDLPILKCNYQLYRWESG